MKITLGTTKAKNALFLHFIWTDSPPYLSLTVMSVTTNTGWYTLLEILYVGHTRTFCENNFYIPVNAQENANTFFLLQALSGNNITTCPMKP